MWASLALKSFTLVYHISTKVKIYHISIIQLTLPCSLETVFECVPVFRTLSRYILADPREPEGRMRAFAEEGLPYDEL